jgi:putative Mg2+ transporter-C (MgtC) family protein
VNDIAYQLDVAVRLLIASGLGAVIGLEREIHAHPAGMRTHLLVALGSALFTVLSIFGFPPAEGAPLDPSRVAAQIVSGIGFLGAGAIIKDGFTVRGLTTAASLWASAAVGMAAGAQQHIVAVVATSIIVFSLWPLSRVADRLHGIGKDADTVHFELESAGAIADVSRLLTEHGVELVRVQTEESDDGTVARVGIRPRPSSKLDDALAAIRELEGVRVVEPRSGDGD